MGDAWQDAEVVKQFVHQQRSTPDYLERPAIEALLPRLENRRVLDLGAGCGDWASWAANQGAAWATAVEKSEAMKTYAHPHPAVSWLEEDMETSEFPSESFDCILAVRSFTYIADYAGLLKRIVRWLAPQGCLVFSVEHPLVYANSCHEWIADDRGRPVAWPVDSYLLPGPRTQGSAD